jgi:hypothetical protein
VKNECKFGVESWDTPLFMVPSHDLLEPVLSVVKFSFINLQIGKTNSLLYY